MALALCGLVSGVPVTEQQHVAVAEGLLTFQAVFIYIQQINMIEKISAVD